MARWSVVGLLVVALTVMAAGGAAAQTTLPVAPEPSLCTNEALAVDELVMGLAMGIAASPVAAAPAFTLPEGTPADEATVTALTERIVGTVACNNAGNYLAFLSSFTEESIQTLLVGEGLTIEGLMGVAMSLSTPVPLDPAQYASVVAIHDVTVLPDGRVGALVETIYPQDMPEVQVDYLVFIDEEGVWMVDEIVEDLEGQIPPQFQAAG